jgi:hypothetical protein
MKELKWLIDMKLYTSKIELKYIRRGCGDFLWNEWTFIITIVSE